jgi:glutamate/tyrosine decarboxylase-like PLP-dependent enzyme
VVITVLGEKELQTKEYNNGQCINCVILGTRSGAQAVVSYFKIPKILQDSPSRQIFRRMYRALNVGKKITNYTVCL